MVKVLAPAREESIEAAEYYELQREGLGLRFLELFEFALARIDETPLACPPYTAVGAPKGARHTFMRPFQECVVFVPRQPPVVLAVAHGRRRPGYWRHRLQLAQDS